MNIDTLYNGSLAISLHPLVFLRMGKKLPALSMYVSEILLADIAGGQPFERVTNPLTTTYYPFHTHIWILYNLSSPVWLPVCWSVQYSGHIHPQGIHCPEEDCFPVEDGFRPQDERPERI
jgi:hypothetical protein